MRLFNKKCGYCRTKIEKGKEIIRDVKVLGYIGTHSKNFCSNEHANKYEQELKEYSKQGNKKKGCC